MSYNRYHVLRRIVLIEMFTHHGMLLIFGILQSWPDFRALIFEKIKFQGSAAQLWVNYGIS